MAVEASASQTVTLFAGSFLAHGEHNRAIVQAVARFGPEKARDPPA
jgi:hypothetical protein